MSANTVKHTPGPWRFVPGGNRPEITSEESWLVCRVESLRFVSDAHLISAAPDLLAALALLVADCAEYARINNLHNSDGSPATNHAMRQARAALLKAHGISTPEAQS